MKVIDGRISENFKIQEFVCPCCKEIMINERVLKFYGMIQGFRNWYNRSINVNSSYRCKKHNTKVGGSTNSYHLQGLAVDFSLPGEFYKFSVERKEEFIFNVIVKWTSLGGSTVGVYDTFLHLDYGNRNTKNRKDIHILDYRNNRNYKL